MSSPARFSFKGGSQGSSRGSREKVTRKPRNSREQILRETEETEPARGFYSEVPMAVVGGSVSVGMSTDYAREKIEVSVWESRPVRDNPQDRERVKNEIAADLRREAIERLDACAREFFPEIAGDLSPAISEDDEAGGEED